ncbi:hypothetical protein Dsin_001205 [Dipteronia sinensis]|uniref:RNase H type-1 domain-containing protein n=1 Tax=Dipteronia sinensis TaxID=43782 RepID=A0AAE0B551_9ROSI|nr:hypothetical protein Dsin_001205 [Dipteronia sinensis]
MMKGAEFGREGIHITHLQFADDTMLFIQPKEEYLLNARRILRCFEMASGLKLNFKKSCVRNFFWGGGSEKKKIHPIKWEVLSKSKEKGGVGIGSILVKNKGLLAKWAWRFGSEEVSLWKRVIGTKYGVSNDLLRWDWNCGTSRSDMVKAVGSLFQQGTLTARVLEEGLRVVVGRGDKARLWEDILVEGTPLRTAFPRIYILAVKKSGKCLEEVYPGERVNFGGVWYGVYPPKVELFVWQLLHGRILVKEVLCRFGMVLDGNGVNVVLSRSLIEWWTGLVGLCHSIKSERAWRVLFFAVTWTIWETRNNKIFKDGEVNAAHAEDMIRFRVAWWFKFLSGGSTDPVTLILLNIADHCTDSKKRKFPNRLEWFPPNKDVLKFNVDGAARETVGPAGIGGVLRNYQGKVCCIFSEHIGIHDAITAEVWAIARACEIIKNRPELSGKTIVIVSDSQVAVSWINDDDRGSSVHTQTITDIRNALGSRGRSSIVFSPREFNSLADNLAKKGSRSVRDLLTWSDL